MKNTIWIVTIERANSEDGTNSRFFYKRKKDALDKVQSLIDHAKSHKYLIQSGGDERQSLHFTNPENPEEDYIVYMYKAGNPLKMDPGVSSKMYHYRDSYYFDCTRNANSGLASVYLYDGRYPDEKYGIGHIAIEQFADDQNILSAMIPDAEALISELEKLGGDEEDNPFEM